MYCRLGSGTSLAVGDQKRRVRREEKEGRPSKNGGAICSCRTKREKVTINDTGAMRFLLCSE